MINKDGGGARKFLDFVGASCYEGGHIAHGVLPSPPVPPLEKTLLDFLFLSTSLVTDFAH